MNPDFYVPVMTWLVIGAVTGWIAAPLMRLRRSMILVSVAAGMAGALVGGVLITLLKSVAGSEMTGSGAGTLMFVFACAGMMLTTIPRARNGTRHQPQLDPDETPQLR